MSLRTERNKVKQLQGFQAFCISLHNWVYRKLKGLRTCNLRVAPISVGVCLEKSLHLGKAQDRVSR